MDFSTIVVVPSIALVAYGVGALCKNAKVVNDNMIPAIVATIGVVLGIVGYYTGAVKAENWLDALAIGFASGGLSTWANQLYKKFGNTES